MGSWEIEVLMMHALGGWRDFGTQKYSKNVCGEVFGDWDPTGPGLRGEMEQHSHSSCCSQVTSCSALFPSAGLGVKRALLRRLPQGTLVIAQTSLCKASNWNSSFR